ncbi:MAG: PQQ-dependent sugar dehydrogenase [Acidobacteriota bacterium]
MHTRRLSTRTGIVFLALSWALAAAAALPAIELPEGFENTQVLASLDSPAGMAFSPDGRLFFAERITGRLRIAVRDELSGAFTVLAEPFYSFDTPVDDEGNPERHRSSGLRDLAFDPDFARNGYLYAFYMRHNPRHNRLVRIKADPDDPNVALEGSELLLLDLPYSATGSSGSHNGGGVEFGADGRLYVTTGDGWSGGDDVQSLETYTGKVFRLEPDGSIPQDNPFYNQATGPLRGIYALGLRNPFSISFEALSGKLFVNDARGPEKADIYLLEAGANYGHQGYDGLGAPRAPFTDGAQIGGALITGGAWYPAGGSFPAEYHGNYFITLWGTNSANDSGDIHRVLGSGDPTVEGFASDVRLGDAKPVLTRVDPLTGDLFYMLTTYQTGEASVHRIRFTGQSTVATPAIAPPGGQFYGPVTVSLETATPGAAIRYTLDGSEPALASPLYTGAFSLDQTATVRARAFAAPLLPSPIAEASFQIGPVANLPPVAIAGPPQRVALGATVTLNGSASFDPDGDDELLAESWTQTAGPPLDFAGDDLVVFLEPAELGTYEFLLEVADGQESDSDTTSLEVVACVDDVTDGLIGRWSFEEGTGEIALDSSSGALNGGLLGPLWVTETADGSAAALDFDGVDDRVRLGTFDLGGEALTFSLWFRADDFGQMDGRFLSKARGVQDEDHVFMLSTIRSGGESRLRFRLKAGGSTTTLIADSGALASGVWTHAAAVWDGQDMRLYKDGVLVGSTPKTGAVATDPTVPVAIGDQPQGGRPFDGVIDEVRLYSRALSPAELDVLITGEGLCGLFSDTFETGTTSAWSLSQP